MCSQVITKHQSHRSSMFCLSSPPLALKGQLKLTTTILLVFFLFTLYITSCEARHIRANSKDSSNKSTLTPKDKAAEVGDEKQIRTASTVHGTGKTGVVAGSSIDQSMSTGATLINGSGNSSRGSNGQQRGSKAATAYTAGTLVAMDYPVARAAPAVHNR